MCRMSVVSQVRWVRCVDKCGESGKVDEVCRLSVVSQVRWMRCV